MKIYAFHATRQNALQGVPGGKKANQGLINKAFINVSALGKLGSGIYVSTHYHQAKQYGDYIYLCEFEVDSVYVTYTWEADGSRVAHGSWRDLGCSAVYHPNTHYGGQFSFDDLCVWGSSLQRAWLVRYPDGTHIPNDHFDLPEKLHFGLQTAAAHNAPTPFTMHLRSWSGDVLDWSRQKADPNNCKWGRACQAPHCTKLHRGGRAIDAAGAAAVGAPPAPHSAGAVARNHQQACRNKLKYGNCTNLGCVYLHRKPSAAAAFAAWAPFGAGSTPTINANAGSVAAGVPPAPHSAGIAARNVALVQCRYEVQRGACNRVGCTFLHHRPLAGATAPPPPPPPLTRAILQAGSAKPVVVWLDYTQSAFQDSGAAGVLSTLARHNVTVRATIKLDEAVDHCIETVDRSRKPQPREYLHSIITFVGGQLEGIDLIDAIKQVVPTELMPQLLVYSKKAASDATTRLLCEAKKAKVMLSATQLQATLEGSLL